MIKCKFCNEELSSARSFKKHQTTAQYCLKLQGKTEELRKISENIGKCPKCGCTDSNKYRLRKHVSNCTIVNQVAQTINNTTIQNNNLTINIYGSTLSSDELVTLIQKRLVPLLVPAVPNLSEMCRITADNAVNENGNAVMAVTDVSRNKFLLRYDDGDHADNGGHKTASILRPPFIEATMESYNQNGNDEALELIENIKDKPFVDSLAKTFPSSLDALHADEKRILGMCARKEQELEIKLQKLIDAKKKDTDRKKAIENAKKVNLFIDKCVKISDGLYMHTKYRYLVELSEDGKYNLSHKRRPNSDTDSDFTKADLKHLCELGMSAYINQRYSLATE